MSEREKDAVRPPQAECPTGAVQEADEEVSREELEELMRKVDRESNARKLFGIPRWIVYWIAVAFSCFQIYTAAFGLLPAQLQRSIHLSFTFALVYLLFPARLSRTSDRPAWHNLSVDRFRRRGRSLHYHQLYASDGIRRGL